VPYAFEVAKTNPPVRPKIGVDIETVQVTPEDLIMIESMNNIVKSSDSESELIYACEPKIENDSSLELKKKLKSITERLKSKRQLTAASRAAQRSKSLVMYNAAVQKTKNFLKKNTKLSTTHRRPIIKMESENHRKPAQKSPEKTEHLKRKSETDNEDTSSAVDSSEDEDSHRATDPNSHHPNHIYNNVRGSRGFHHRIKRGRGTNNSIRRPRGSSRGGLSRGNSGRPRIRGRGRGSRGGKLGPRSRFDPPEGYPPDYMMESTNNNNYYDHYESSGQPSSPSKRQPKKIKQSSSRRKSKLKEKKEYLEEELYQDYDSRYQYHHHPTSTIVEDRIFRDQPYVPPPTQPSSMGAEQLVLEKFRQSQKQNNSAISPVGIKRGPSGSMILPQPPSSSSQMWINNSNNTISSGVVKQPSVVDSLNILPIISSGAPVMASAVVRRPNIISSPIISQSCPMFSNSSALLAGKSPPGILQPVRKSTPHILNKARSSYNSNNAGTNILNTGGNVANSLNLVSSGGIIMSSGVDTMIAVQQQQHQQNPQIQQLNVPSISRSSGNIYLVQKNSPGVVGVGAQSSNMVCGY